MKKLCQYVVHLAVVMVAWVIGVMFIMFSKNN